MKKRLFISAKQSIILLRISLAIIFLTHSITRIANSTIEQFGGFMESKGFIYGTSWVLGITSFELIGGLLLAFGYFPRVISIGFILMLIVGIILIHASLGWFVGEHGTGGSEYSFILIMSLLVISTNENQNQINN